MRTSTCWTPLNHQHRASLLLDGFQIFPRAPISESTCSAVSPPNSCEILKGFHSTISHEVDLGRDSQALTWDILG